MKVPLLDLKSQYESLKRELDEAILRVAASQHFILGPEVEAFETEIASYLGVKHAVGVSSGTDALLVALMAVDIGPGDEVIVPDFSFFATAGVVARLGATPVFADIDSSSFNISPASIRSLITRSTRAIIPVHLFGQSADMEPIMLEAEKHGLIVVEDAAQAIGTRYRDGRRVGTIGRLGCFSFFPSKNLGGYGDGGLVTTNDDALAQKVRDLRMHGMNPKYYHKYIGGNFRLDAIQAAVLRVKLPHLDSWSEARERNADLYTGGLVTAGISEGPGRTEFNAGNRVLLPASFHEEFAPDIRNLHIYNQYTIRVNGRDDLRAYLAAKEIASEVYYPVPFHAQESFRYLRPDPLRYPNSSTCALQCLSLPVYPELIQEQIEYVVDTIAGWARRQEGIDGPMGAHHSIHRE